MKKSILLFLLSITCYSATQAQLLWKVSGNGLKHPSYLFGTHHLIPIQFLDSVPGLYKAFNACDAVVGEIALNSIDATSRLEMAASMPNHTKMTDLLKGEKYSTVDNELRAVLKLGLKDLSMMNPTLILSMYEMELYKKTTGITDDTQSDSYFQLVAAEKNKKVVGLETVEQQINILFGNGSLERQADILYETIQHKDSALTDMIQLDKLYRAGKLNDLVELSKGKGRKADFTDEEYTKLVDNRNADWMKKLPKLFNNSSCFVAVGTLHLGGKNGLIKQLEKAGYHVKAVE
ncbi:MAG TPA: TraB/GumN family protein [Paludibacter sp.]